ncbi:MAG: META domain-containing protein [Pyrinomonadaceae bacterium]|nr:META domain-containing protein [Pyrinomonadaceae bacterium]
MKGLIRACFLFIAVIPIGSVTVSAKSNRLERSRWIPVEVNGTKVGNTRAFLEFDADAGRFSGNAGCNRMFGTYTVKGSAIDFGPAGTTRMHCGPAMAAETEFLAALSQAKRFRFKGGRLELISGKKAVAKFIAAETGKPQDGVKLEDRKWVLEAIGDSKVGKLEETPFLNFDAAKKSAGGNSSCNAFGGSYETAGAGKIRIFDVISTMRACIEDDRMEIERGFYNGLREADRYKITKNSLELYRGTKLLLTFRGVDK